MKLLYIAPLPVDFDKPGGVQKKVLSHIMFFSSYFETALIYYFNNKVRLYDVTDHSRTIIGTGDSKISLLIAAKKYIRKNLVDCIYIRYPESDHFFISFLKEAKRENVKVLIEIPTYPYDLEGNETIKGRTIRIIDHFYRMRLKGLVDKIITFSEDKEIFGIETINTINGIDFSSIKIARSDIDLDKVIKLSAASAMFKVHGYERLIKGINEYYNNGGKRNIVLYLAGDGDEKQKYQMMVDEYHLKDHVIFLGNIYGQQLDDLYENAALGINSLAIHRQGLIRESTLKAREYAAKGLPILSSSFIDAFSDSDNTKFVFRINPDESSVNVDDLIQFLDHLYNGKNTYHLRKTIRDSAFSVCDYSITLKPIIDYYKGVL